MYLNLILSSSSPQLSTLGQSAQARVESENIRQDKRESHNFTVKSTCRNPIDFVVEVDSLNNISHHQMMMTPGSPVSILQNSPLSHCSPSSSLSLSVFPQSEDRAISEDKISPLSPHYQDEGIESQEGEAEGWILEISKGSQIEWSTYDK